VVELKNRLKMFNGENFSLNEMYINVWNYVRTTE